MSDPNTTTQTPAPAAPSEPTIPSSEPAAESLFDFSIGDSEGTELPFFLGGETEDDAPDEPVEVPAAAPAAEEPPETTASSLAKAKAKLEAKLAARAEADRVAVLQAQVEELEKKANRKLTPAEINAAAREYLETGLTPEQEAAKKREDELEELKAWKASQEEEKARAAAEREAREEVAAVETYLQAHGDERYPYLSSTWTPEFVLAKSKELIESGEAADVHEAFAALEGIAGNVSKKIASNKRAVRAMLKDPDNRAVVLEVLAELGVAPAKAKGAIKAALAGPPTTLTGELKRDSYPVNEGDLPDDDSRRSMLLRAVRGLARDGRGLAIDGDATSD